MKYARTISVSKTGRPRSSYQLSQASLWQVMESRIQCTCVAPEHSLPLWQSHPHVEEVALVILLRCWTSTTTPSDSLLPPEVPGLTPSGDNSSYFTRHKLEPPPPSPPASRFKVCSADPAEEPQATSRAAEPEAPVSQGSPET